MFTQGDPELFKRSLKARFQLNLGKTIEKWSKKTKLTESFTDLNNLNFPPRKRLTRKTQLAQSSRVARRKQKRKVDNLTNPEKGDLGNILFDDRSDGSMAADELKETFRKKPKLNLADVPPLTLPPPLSPTNSEVTEDPLAFSPVKIETQTHELKEEDVNSSSADQTNHLELCRFCLSEISIEFVDIFSDSNEALKIKEMCDLVLPGKIQPSDGLPPNICYQCITDLQISSSFIMRFMEVDHSLRTMFPNFESNEPDRSVDGKFNCENNNNKTFDGGRPTSEEFIIDEICINESCMDFKPYKQDNYSNAEQNIVKIVDVTKPYDVNQDDICGRENENSTERCTEILEQYITDDVSDVNNLIFSQNEFHTLKENTNPSSITNIDTNVRESIKTSTNREIKSFDFEAVFPSATTCLEHVCEKHNGKCSASGCRKNCSLNEPKQQASEKETQLKTICFLCQKVFSSVVACNQHVSEEHSFKCSDCIKVFPKQTELDWHIITTHDKRLECKYCRKVFKESWLRKKHEVWHEVNMYSHKNDYQPREIHSTDISKESLELNMTEIETLIKVKCSHCEAVFTSALARIQHVNEKHSFQCSVCQRMFPTQKKLNKHHLSKHDKRVECLYCGKVFKDSSYRRKHENQHELKMDVKKEEYNTSRLCFICGVVLCSKSSIEAHMRRHENIKPFMCENCGSKFTTKSDLQKHVSHHDETAMREMKFACNVCSKRFAFKVNLYHHQRTHLKTFRFHCEYCHRGFYQRNNLVYHLKKRTLLSGVCPEPNKALMTFTKKERELTTRYECNICGRKFVRSLNCKNHKDLHFLKGDPAEIQKQLDEPEVHFCTECDQYCFSKTELEAHVKEHEVLTKTYDCEFCGKKYSSKRFLTVHLSNHKGETPFKCGICSRSFRTNNKLCQHKLVHTEERPFVCKICHKPFKSKKYLELHSAKHDPEVPAHGTQPFKCPKCGRNYRREFYLKKHIKRVHTSNAYRCVCSLCGRVLKCEADVQIHKLRAHREGMEEVTREATKVESEGTSEEDTEEEWSSDGEIEEENTEQDRVAVEHLIEIPNSNIQIEYIISASGLDSTEIV